MRILEEISYCPYCKRHSCNGTCLDPTNLEVYNAVKVIGHALFYMETGEIFTKRISSKNYVVDSETGFTTIMFDVNLGINDMSGYALIGYQSVIDGKLCKKHNFAPLHKTNSFEMTIECSVYYEHKLNQ